MILMGPGSACLPSPVHLQVSGDLLGGMRALEYLFLNDNRLAGSVPVAELAALRAVKSIHLSNNFFSDIEAAHAELQSALVAARGGGHGTELDMLGHGVLYYGTEYPGLEDGPVAP